MTHARLARDDPSESWVRGLLAQSAFWGPVPAADGIRRCQELLEQAAGNRRLELTRCSPWRAPGDGRPARGGQGDPGPWPWPATWARTGSPPWPGVRGRRPGLAGDPAAAAAAPPRDRVLERQGESGMRSNLTADLAHVLHQLGRPDEALHEAMACQAIAAHDDLFAQVRWRGAAARSLAAHDRVAEAERLPGRRGGLDRHPDRHADHARRRPPRPGRRGRRRRPPADATRHAQAALALYQAGNQPGATRAEAAAAQPVPAADLVTNMGASCLHQLRAKRRAQLTAPRADRRTGAEVDEPGQLRDPPAAHAER